MRINEQKYYINKDTSFEHEIYRYICSSAMMLIISIMSIIKGKFLIIHFNLHIQILTKIFNFQQIFRKSKSKQILCQYECVLLRNGCARWFLRLKDNKIEGFVTFDTILTWFQVQKNDVKFVNTKYPRNFHKALM